MKKKLKKILLIIIGVCLTLSLKVTSKIIINNRFIANYPDTNQEFRLVLLSVFNYYEPYIAPYNYGNYYYQKGKYDDAYDKYKKALSYNIPQNRVCSVRINISMDLIKMSEKKDNDTALKLLNEAKEHLKVCLNINVDDGNGQGGQEGQGDQGGQNGGIVSQQKTAAEMSAAIEKQIDNFEGKQTGEGKNTSQSGQSSGSEGNGSGSDMPSESQMSEIEGAAGKASQERDNTLIKNQKGSGGGKVDSKGCVNCL